MMAESNELSEVNGKLVDDSNHSSAAVLPSPKQPPPESKENIRIRRLAILSFWTVAVILGLPIWWWTTSIHRARLPLQEMMEWADGKVLSIERLV